MANKVMGYVICGYNSVDNLMSEQSSPFRRWTTGSGAGSSYRHQDHRNMYNKQMSEGSTQMSASGTSSNVARWSLGLEHLLADPAGAAAFAQFLDKEFASENIRFWWACEQYNATTDLETRRALAMEIWERHLAEKAPDPVNIDAPAKKATALHLNQSPPELFQQAQKQIFNMLKFDSYQRFLRSGEHAECARADLRGMPLPYDLQHTDTSKLKKSASNASERRRSGGSSLLPWKIRAGGGRERTNTTQPNNTQPPVTDVVKSSQINPGQCTLCRVLLPDGATSVVEVDPTVTVGRLVDRLLQRRNLLCTTYDVLFKDGNQAGTRIEPAAPSDILGGREATVERSCVVRLELRSTCLAVRCRAARRLRHVLRPVLAKYSPHAPPHAHRALTRDGHLVPPDTLMQELDGARLQIVEVSESGEFRGAVDRDDDADSLSDLAVRLQDDPLRDQDTQSVGGASSRGSRVLTTLRPGPHLHHHPPHFLENLRETQQRLRLQKGEPSSTPPASPPATASPRTPPPLPPKPTHRQAPTVV